MMKPMDPAQLVPIKVRLRGALLTRLDAEAAATGCRLSHLIVNHIERSVDCDDTGGAMFSDAARFGILHAIDQLMLAVELKEGKGREDRATRDLIADTVSNFIRHDAGIFATRARTTADAYALQLTAQILGKEIERVTEAAAAGDKAGDEAA